MKTRLVVIALFASAWASATTGDAHAQDRDSGVGVGVETMLAGPSGPSVVFQSSMFHVEGILAFFDQGDETDLTLAGRFWYALHQTGRSDFSVGGGLGILIEDDGGMDGNDTDLEFDIGAQLRAFLVPNVALSVTLGFTLVSTDGEDPIALTGDLVGTGGIAYFFF